MLSVRWESSSTAWATSRLALTPEIAIFALCAFIGDFLPLKVFTRGAEGEITTSTCFAFAALLAAGPLAALIALVAANLIVDAYRRKAAQKVAFNVAQYAISVAAAAVVLKVTTGMPRADGPHLVPSDLAGVMLAIAAFFVVNSTLVATVIALVQRTKVLRYLIDDIFNQVATGGLLLGLAPVVLLAADFFLPAIALLFLPLYAVHRGGRDAIAKQHQALHDALTGLPNRELFRDRIDQAVSSSRRLGDSAVVMIMDLDHFKEINDTLGHHMGDLLLQEVSRRLRVALRESDTVARLGGDEFGVLLPRVQTTEDGDRRRPEPARAPARAVRARGHAAGDRRQHRPRPAPAARRGQRDAPAARRHRDVLGEAVRPRLRALRGRAGPPLAAPPRARGRDAPGDQRGPDPALLPAQGRPAHGPDHGRRGARALGSPRVRDRRAERVRPDRRADRPDHAADVVRARRRDRARCARGRTPAWSSPSRSTSPRARSWTRSSRSRSRACSPAGTSRRSSSSSRSPRAC